MNPLNGSLCRRLPSSGALRWSQGVALLLTAGCLAFPGSVLAETFFLYAGSYTSGTSKGIYAWQFDSQDGSLKPLGLEAATSQPAYVWPSPDGKTLYAVNWEDEGGVSAFRIDRRTGALSLLDKVSAAGRKPNQIMLHPSGKLAVSVNYTTGNVVAYKVRADGSLSDAFWTDQHVGQPLSPKQSGPKAHGVAFSPDGQFMYVADLGLDRVYGYRVDADRATITPGAPPFTSIEAGAGPRRMQMSTNGKFLYVNHETDSQVSVFAVSGTDLKEVQRLSTIPPGFTGPNTTAEIILSPDGRYLYVSNRGSDSIAIFNVDQATGNLTTQGFVAAGGRTPRNLRLDPTAGYLFSSNEDGGTITVFKRDPATGGLSQLAAKGEIDTPGGLCLVATDRH